MKRRALSAEDAISQIVAYATGTRYEIDGGIRRHIFTGLAKHFQTGKSLSNCLPVLRGAPRKFQRMKRDINLLLAFECIPNGGDMNRAKALCEQIERAQKRSEAEWDEILLPFNCKDLDRYIHTAIATGEKIPTDPKEMNRLVENTRTNLREVYGPKR